MIHIETDKPLRSFNTFGIDASAKYFTEIKSVEEFQELREAKEFSGEKLILGGGSNILLTKDFNGLVIKNSTPGMEVIREEGNDVWVKVAAGEVWHQFVLFCIERGFAGIENLSLIPGQAGAAPMQNIGAYGVEIKETFSELEAVSIASGEQTRFTNADCRFGYRESVFKNKYKNQFLITSVTFKLSKVPHFNISYGDVKKTLEEMKVTELSLKAVSDAVIKIRMTKLPDPKVLGNAGSFFKNPVIPREQFDIFHSEFPQAPFYEVDEHGERLNKSENRQIHYKIPAGYLIEQCGWKGKVVGRTGSHKTQALVLVNYGGATGNEVYNLALEIQQSVKEKFGIDILPEVNLI